MKKIIYIMTIAYRNIFRRRSRTMIVGTAVFLSTFLLLLTNSLASGVHDKVVKDQINIDTGHLSIVWREDYEFYPESQEYEKTVQTHLIQLLQTEPKIREFYLANFGEVHAGFSGINEIEGVLVGIDFAKEMKSFGKSIELRDGSFPLLNKNQIILSEKNATKYGVGLGSFVTILVNTFYGAVNVMDFEVCGIYKNGTPWHENYFYTDPASFAVLFDFAHIATTIKIISTKEKYIPLLKQRLNSFIQDNDYPFAVKDFNEELGMYRELSETNRIMFNSLNVILITIIILGIQSIIILSINERIKEISTLRALGFYRSDIGLLLLFEYLFIALFFESIGIIVSLILIVIVRIVRIPLNSDVLKYLFGNSYLQPVLKVSDLIITFLVIFFLVLFSVLPQMGKTKEVNIKSLN